ncbi:hypothetical protein ACM25N_17125 [Roseovarius sp. C7]|uniref:hypothetical protein n=1 Tax=Roseovarius sp. C7 TaxID=3398643 RepID=UPI0039F69CE5
MQQFGSLENENDEDMALGSSVLSIKKLQSYYLLLSLAFFLVTFQQLSQQKLVEFSGKAELLVELLNWQNIEAVELSRDRLFAMTRKGIKIADGLNDQYVLPSVSQYEELGFAEDPILGGSVAVLELRSHPRIQCEVLMIERKIDGKYGAYAPTMAGERFVLFSMAKARFFDASDCVSGYRGQLSGLIIHSKDENEHFFVLPISWLEPLPGLLYPERFMETPLFEDKSGQIEISRGVEAALFEPTNQPVVTSASALRNALARSFSTQTGGKYRGTDLREAVDDLFAKKAGDASFAGINAPLNFVLHTAPLFLLFVLWQLHRAVKQIDNPKDDDYWVISDASDLPGLLVASAYALLPYFFSVVMAVSFCSALSLYGVYFGYLVRFDEEMRLVIEQAPPRGWLRGQGLFSIIVGGLWWLHMFLAMQVSLNLLTLTQKSKKAVGVG